MEVGDQLRIYPGCHKRVLEDCRDRFRIPGSLLFDKGNVRNSAASRTCPGARSRPCRRVAASDALGIRVTGTPATVKPTAITLTAASLGASQMTIGNLCYDEQNDRILFFTELDSVSHLLAYRCLAGTR